LKAKSGLQQGRLSEDHHRKATTSSAASRKGTASSGRVLDGEAKLRAKAIRQKKEGLKYGVERLELEVLQKERQLRKTLET
jgi:DASH complex subunit SPC19